MKTKVLKIFEISGYKIELQQNKNSTFNVRYGQQIESFLNYSRACEELGSCILHALSLEGLEK